MTYLNIGNMTTREDWNNGGFDGFSPPVPSRFYDHDPHESFDACGRACKAHEDCFQYTYHLRKCLFVRSIRYGKAEEPGLGKTSKKVPTKKLDWSPEDLRYMAGWDTEKIREWMDARPCEQVRWVRPSTKRIF